MAALPVLVGSIDNSTKYDPEGVGLPQNGTFDEVAFIRAINDAKAVLLIPAMLYTVILMIIGVIGNPIAIYIYGFRWEKTTLKYFLLSLAVIDLVNCLITMPTEIALMRHYYYFNNAEICRVSRFTTYVMNNASSVILLVIAVDRYIRICKPYNKPISVRVSKIACFSAIVLGVCVSWPAIVMYGRLYVPYYLKDRVIQLVICNVENQFIHTPYPLAFFIYLLVAFSLIATVMSVLYILIGRTILMRKRMKKSRAVPYAEAMKKILNVSITIENNDECSEYPEGVPDSPRLNPVTKNTDKQRQLSNSVRDGRQSKRKWCKSSFRPGRSTSMLFTITLVYILSFLPYLIVVIIRTHVGSSFYSSLTKGEQVFVNIFLRSYLVNNCANPVVYGMCNSKFRQECKNLFSRITCRKQTSPL